MSNGIQVPAPKEEEHSHVVLDVDVEKDPEKEISNQLKRIMGDLPSEEEKYQIVSIPKVPERLLHISENDSYEPRIISIGPYHRGKVKLQDMENHKWRYVHAILSRNENCSLRDYVDGMKALEKQARSCYSKNTIKLDHSEFVEMMLLDGCFIVEFLLRLEEKMEDELHAMIWLVPQIQYDILLLENQLPFFILEHIFDLVTTKKGQSAYPSSIMQLAANVCRMFSVCKMLSPMEKAKIHLPKSVYHLLHLYYSFLFPQLKPGASSTSNSASSEGGFQVNAAAETEEVADEEIAHMIPSASVLDEAGIKFKKKGGSILAVGFSNGIMEIPPLFIDCFTMYQFRNLLTFEQLCPNMKPLFTTYVLFLDYIVNTSKDVELLHNKHIIEHMLCSNEEVALLLNKLTRATFRPSRHYLCGMYKAVNAYCRTKRHRWRAALVHNYFNNPWAVLSVVAAVFLLALTLFQTFFAVYTYLRPSNIVF